LLIYYDARRAGHTINLFSDRAGDAYGLDAFDSEGIGYQYKFFPSPLSDDHRAEIVKALKKAIAEHEKSRIQKWVLVTPDDLVNSVARVQGGDVEWFKKLKAGHDAPFELEHMGHTKLQALFLNAEALCLHYYPEIVPNGLSRRDTIQTIRKQYDNNLKSYYNRIEFVGMSVRKEDASRGLPMQAIYIPLETVAEGTAADDDKAERTNPLKFLEYGRRTVILGDPGSGKSTVLRFLALAGLLPELQARYSARADDRLTVLVTLRRYADALKSNRDLPLLDYIVASIRADFSIPDISVDFLKHFLETGRVVLQFDGVDELPDLGFKTVVRDRVRSMVTSYPGNTVIVTSRIAGYEAEARFAGSDPFHHCQMASLQEPQQRCFVEDWHRERTEQSQEQAKLVEDLMSILTDSDNVAIRELARNPLLLTIMVLVHRIDVVLPDERVKLYEKCIETLMFTWLNRKKDLGSGSSRKERAEQRLLRRLAALAQCMHEQAGSDGADKRAVVSAKQLEDMLTRHIMAVEYRGNETEKNNAEDEAQDFLKYVREQAGLMIEAGSNLYSFLHLTFQEYLAARHIIIQSEARGGDSYIWEKIEPLAADARWREVIRLLVAERKSEESQRNLTGKILELGRLAEGSLAEANLAALCGGLLIDRVPAAAERAPDILAALLLATARAADDQGIVTALLGQLTTLVGRADNAGSIWDEAVEQALAQAGSGVKAGVCLTAFTVPLARQRVEPLMDVLLDDDAQAAALADGLLWSKPANGRYVQTARDQFFPYLQYGLLKSPDSNFLTNLTASSLPQFGAKELGRLMLTAAASGSSGPFMDCAYNQAIFHASTNREVTQEASSVGKEKYNWHRSRARDRDRVLDRVLDRVRDRDRVLGRVLDRVRDRDRVLDRVPDRDRVLDRVRVLGRVRVRDQHVRRGWELLWSEILKDRELQDAIINFILLPLNLPRSPIWWEALRRHYLPNLCYRHTLFRSETLTQTVADLKRGKDEDAVWRAACWLLLDLGPQQLSILNLPEEVFEQLIAVCKRLSHPVLEFILALHQACRTEEPDETAIAAVKAMFDNPSPKLRETLVATCWIDPRRPRRQFRVAGAAGGVDPTPLA
jgi:energy-coupling factor transporter ATP-binding protein EcfA2